MAKITYTAIIQNIQGSVAGSTFKRAKSGGIILNKPRPKQTKTASQYDKRRIMSILSNCWQQLTTTDKKLWDEYASLTKQRQSGYNAHLQLNIALLSANNIYLTHISAPPPTPQTPTAIENLTREYKSPTRNSINWKGPLSGSYFTQVYYTVEVGYHMNNKESWQLVGTTISSIGWCYHNHSYPTGTQLKYHARTIDTYGRTSPRTQKI